MNIKYTIDPKMPREFLGPLMKANEIVEREARSVAPRVSADWEYVENDTASPKFRLILSDSAGGSMYALFDGSEIVSESIMKKKIHRFWGRLLRDTSSGQRERVSRLVVEYLAEAESWPKRIPRLFVIWTKKSPPRKFISSG